MSLLPGIVLAAGASSRMGTPKALLATGSSRETFVERIVRTLTACDIAPIVVVVREPLSVAVTALLPAATVVVNPDPDRGQLSSLRCGLSALGTPGAVLMTLVDLPFVHEDTVRAVVDAWRATGAPLVRPRLGDRHGHPAIFGLPVISALEVADVAFGAKPVLAQFAPDAVSVPVTDRGAIEDIDTPEAYRRAVGPGSPPG
jgi:molybdenum cofactor cytidylyltransferase